MSNPAIICIDDEYLILKSLERELETAFNGKYQIEQAESASEAVDLVESLLQENIEIPVIFCDYIIPDMRGDLLLEKLHRMVPSSCKILLTGHADVEGITRAVNRASLFGYIAKPWKKADLIQRTTDALSLYYHNQELEIHRHKIMEKNIELEGLNRLLEEEKVKLDLALAASNLKLWEWDIRDNCLLTDFDFSGNNEGGVDRTYSLKELIQRIHPDDRQPFTEIAALTRAEDEKAQSGDLRFKNDKGEYRWLSVYGRYSSRITRKAHPVLIGTARDITQKKLLDEQLRENQKLQAVGRLAGGISHDFNNTLQAILGYSRLVQTALEKESHVSEPFIQEVIHAGERAKILTRQLLTFSRREQFHPTPCDLNELIRGIMNMLSRILGDLITVRLELKEGLPLIEADSGQLEQAVVNLCINAKDSMPGGGEILISSGERDEMLFFSVEDSGCGIPADEIAHVLKPFYTTKDKEKGTGLGLATVAAIIQNHKGEIRLESEVDTGTRVEIELPMLTDSTLFKPEALQSISALPLKDTRRCTILFAEDDPVIRQLVPSTLKGEGYEVIIAENGKEAVRLFHEYRDIIDMLVFDVIMPEMNGREACDEIMKFKPGIPVIFTSGYSSDLLKSEYMVRIQGRLIQKPYLMKELQETISGMLDQ